MFFLFPQCNFPPADKTTYTAANHRSDPTTYVAADKATILSTYCAAFAPTYLATFQTTDRATVYAAKLAAYG
jgi:hypothetical protein